MIHQRFNVGAIVSTHSRPKAAVRFSLRYISTLLFQHTAARRRLASRYSWICRKHQFQHTAARRRLVEYYFS